MRTTKKVRPPPSSPPLAQAGVETLGHGWLDDRRHVFPLDVADRHVVLNASLPGRRGHLGAGIILRGIKEIRHKAAPSKPGTDDVPKLFHF